MNDSMWAPSAAEEDAFVNILVGIIRKIIFICDLSFFLSFLRFAVAVSFLCYCCRRSWFLTLCHCLSSRVAVSCNGCNHLLHYPAFRCLVDVSTVQIFCFVSVQENKVVLLAWARTSDSVSSEVCEHIQ